MSKTLLVLFLLAAVAVSAPSYCTYHLYNSFDQLITVACSDGQNGLMSWGYNDLSQVFPYVTAWQGATWNSPYCGSCVKMTHKDKFVYLTVIDQCGDFDMVESHFDISKEAFYELFGDEGIQYGHMKADY